MEVEYEDGTGIEEAREEFSECNRENVGLSFLCEDTPIINYLFKLRVSLLIHYKDSMTYVVSRNAESLCGSPEREGKNVRV